LPRHCSSSVRSSEPDGQSGSLSASSESCVGCVTKKTTGNVECKNVAPPSRQCTSAHSVVYSRNVSKAFYSCPSTIFIFAWIVPPDFFIFPKIKNYPERKKCLSGRGHHYEYDRWNESNLTNNLLTVLQKVGKDDGGICCARKLFYWDKYDKL
jgi:hypothetical protein